MNPPGDHPHHGRLAPLSRLLAVCTPDADGAETLRFAARFAQEHDAAMTVLSVVEPPAGLDRIAEAAGLAASEVTQRLAAERREQLTAMVAEAVAAGSPDIQVAIGKRFIEIIALAIESRADLVIKAAEPLGGIGGFLFASTDQHLLRKCPVPVWLRCDAGQAAPRKIVAAVDVDETMTQEPETLLGLNHRILETAAWIAAKGPVDIHVIHAWDAPGEGLVQLWSASGRTDQAVADYVDGVQHSYAQALDRLVEQAQARLTHDNVRFVPHSRRGVPREIIPQQVAALQADVLVMGTVARTGVPGLIIGNTAEDILNSVTCSVVTVKPPGYHSPVTGHAPV